MFCEKDKIIVKYPEFKLGYSKNVVDPRYQTYPIKT